MKASHNIDLAGHSVPVRSEEGLAYLDALAQSVQARIDEVFDRKRGPAPARAVLLVAMELADELYREKDLHQKLRRQVQKRLSELDAALLAHEKMLRPPSEPAASEGGPS